MQLENIIFRKMNETDIPQVAEIEGATFSTPWTEDGFRESLAVEYTLYYVAEEAGEILGYCGLYQSSDEADITNVAVKESARNRNIATLMLQELMNEGEKRGIEAFTLEVRVGNAPAIRLYEKLGFESVGIRKNFYRNPVEDANIMWKR